MKKILNYNLFAVAALVLLSSCNDDTTFTKSNKTTVKASISSLTLVEGATGQVTLTLDEPQNVATDLKIELLSGTGAFRDFSVSYGLNDPIDIETTVDDGWGLIGYKLVIPAYTTSLTFDINALEDFNAEASESLVLKLSSAGNSIALFPEGEDKINLTINNKVSTNFDVEMAWAGNFPSPHGTVLDTEYVGVDNLKHGYCSFDFDLEIYDASISNVLEFDYDNCPAVATISASAPNGDYVIMPSFYSRTVAAGSVPKSGEIIFPVKVTMGKKGSFAHTTDMTGKFKYSTGGVAQGNPNGYVPIAIVTKTGTNYVLKDFNTAAVLGSGRYASLIEKIKKIKRSKK
ncbi:hypothetical protein [Flavobacterium sp.]|uniref:hypothetical protein n=1 Tax=Flavobacterium sp. TaxID=239 RepID=UPI000ED838F9|nr:hypothetical protein [Flavobacterium sp.]HCQ11968.1 hypothetical protein [Flavobacterium sp.]